MSIYESNPRVTSDLVLELRNLMDRLVNNSDCAGLSCPSCPMGVSNGCALLRAAELFGSTNAAKHEALNESGQRTVPNPAQQEQDISKPDDLTKLRKAYTLMRDMVDPAADDPSDEYLYCTRTAQGDPDCGNCPFAITGSDDCGVVQVKVLLQGMRGRRDKSLR